MGSSEPHHRLVRFFVSRWGDAVLALTRTFVSIGALLDRVCRYDILCALSDFLKFGTPQNSRIFIVLLPLLYAALVALSRVEEYVSIAAPQHLFARVFLKFPRDITRVCCPWGDNWLYFLGRMLHTRSLLEGPSISPVGIRRGGRRYGTTPARGISTCARK